MRQRALCQSGLAVGHEPRIIRAIYMKPFANLEVEAGLMQVAKSADKSDSSTSSCIRGRKTGSPTTILCMFCDCLRNRFHEALTCRRAVMLQDSSSIACRSR
jgi:hypothetical protein